MGIDGVQHTDDEGPSDLEAAYIEAGVEATGALFDGLEYAGVPT
jgi:hypothetical protein